MVDREPPPPRDDDRLLEEAEEEKDDEDFREYEGDLLRRRLFRDLRRDPEDSLREEEE